MLGGSGDLSAVTIYVRSKPDATENSDAETTDPDMQKCTKCERIGSANFDRSQEIYQCECKQVS